MAVEVDDQIRMGGKYLSESIVIVVVSTVVSGNLRTQ